MQVFLNGLGVSSYYILFAVGLSLVFGTMKVINFAHGELFMLGAVISWVVVTMGSGLLSTPVLFFLGLVVAIVVVGGLGIALERGIFRRLRLRPLSSFMASVGLIYILQTIVGESPFGRLGKFMPTILPGSLKVGDATLPHMRLVLIIMAVLLIGGLWFFLQRTKYGRALRATAQDREAAILQGMSTNRISAIALGLGSALAAAAGALMSPELVLTPYVGGLVIWKAFIIVIVGGMGSIGGTIAASLLFGFLDSSIFMLGAPEFIIMIDVLIMLVILALRPQGILGREK